MSFSSWNWKACKLPAAEDITAFIWLDRAPAVSRAGILHLSHQYSSQRCSGKILSLCSCNPCSSSPFPHPYLHVSNPQAMHRGLLATPTTGTCKKPVTEGRGCATGGTKGVKSLQPPPRGRPKRCCDAGGRFSGIFMNAPVCIYKPPLLMHSFTRHISYKAFY